MDLILIAVVLADRVGRVEPVRRSFLARFPTELLLSRQTVALAARVVPVGAGGSSRMGEITIAMVVWRTVRVAPVDLWGPSVSLGRCSLWKTTRTSRQKGLRSRDQCMSR